MPVVALHGEMKKCYTGIDLGEHRVPLFQTLAWFTLDVFSRNPKT